MAFDITKPSMAQATLSLAFGSIVENFRATTQCDSDVWSGQNLSAYGASTATTFTLYGSSGGANYETFEIGSNRADADAARTASLVAFANINTATYKALGAIDFYTSGPTANKRGGMIIFSTRPDNSTTMTEALRIDRLQNVGIGGAPSYFVHMQRSVAGGMNLVVDNQNAGAGAYASFDIFADKISTSLRAYGSAFNTFTRAGQTLTQWAELWADTNSGTGPQGFLIGITTDKPLLFAQNATRRWQIISGGAFVPFSDNAYDIGSTSARVRAVYSGRVVTGAATPTASVTGAGTTGAIAVDTGSSDMAAILTITPGGTGIAATGTAVLTFSTGNGAYGTNTPVVIVELANGTGTWNARATAIVSSTISTTSVTINWDNNAVALTGSQTYKMHVHIIGK